MNALKFSWIAALALTAGYFGAPQAAQAQQTVVLQNASRGDWQQTLNRYSGTHMIRMWDIRVVGGEPSYTLVMVRGTGPRFQLRTGRSYEAFRELKRVYAEQGYQLQKQVQYNTCGRTLYGGYWVRY